MAREIHIDPWPTKPPKSHRETAAIFSDCVCALENLREHLHRLVQDGERVNIVAAEAVNLSHETTLLKLELAKVGLVPLGSNNERDLLRDIRANLLFRLGSKRGQEVFEQLRGEVQL